MINSVVVTNYLGESLTMVLESPEESGLSIERIDGLDPCKAVINLTDVVAIDGAIFNSARVGNRNIVFSFALLEKPTIEDTRHMLYKYFPIKKLLTIAIATDSRTMWTTGYVESNAINIFSKKETAVISVVCPNAYFTSDKVNVGLFSGIVSTFKFPFSNNSLTNKLIVFGNIVNATEKSIIYEGDAETGIKIYLHAIGPVVNPSISKSDTRELMTIDTALLADLTGFGIIDGDDIVINTNRGEKSVKLKRAGVWRNILNTVGRDTDWFQLASGDNVFYCSADSGINNLQIQMEYQILYEGV
jgi:hypothetical protein